MLELQTKALVLSKETSGEYDAALCLYTEKFGKITARARSIKKPISKSGHHLEPLYFADVRLVEGKGGILRLLDALSYNKAATIAVKNDPQKAGVFLKFINFINEMTYEMHPDEHLWNFLEKIYSNGKTEGQINREALKILGFDPEHASCKFCQKETGLRFLVSDHIFVCQNCYN